MAPWKIMRDGKSGRCDLNRRGGAQCRNMTRNYCAHCKLFLCHYHVNDHALSPTHREDKS